MSNPIEAFYEPQCLGDWLGANGPGTPTSPNAKEETEWIREYLGVRWIRLNTGMEWFTRVDYFPKYLDLVEYATSLGLIVVPSISGAPDGMRLNDSSASLPSDAGLDALQQTLLAPFEALYDVGLRVVETHNEWDGPGMHGLPVDVPRVVEAHRVVGEAWRNVTNRRGDGRTLLIPGGTSGASFVVSAAQAPGAFPPGDTEGKLYPRQAYRSFISRRGGQFFDHANHHAGAFPYNPYHADQRQQPYNGLAAVDWIHDEVAAPERGRTTPFRVFVTELPWPDDVDYDDVSATGEEGAACRARADLIFLLERMSRGIAGPTMVYHGCRDGVSGHDAAHLFGMRREDGSAKPTAEVVKRYAALPFSLCY
jgi:hypothetical protein